MSLDKILRAAGTAPRDPLAGLDDDSELVLAAQAALDTVAVLLAKDDDSGDDKDSDSDGDGKGGHEDHATYKAMIMKHMPPKMAAAICKKHDDKVKATAALTAARLALAGIGLDRSMSWVELTAADPGYLALGGDAPGNGAKPYGDVKYADPGWQKDGKKRYPLDTKKHVLAANSYINQGDNADAYSAGQLAKIKAAIAGAAKEQGITLADDKAA